MECTLWILQNCREFGVANDVVVEDAGTLQRKSTHVTAHRVQVQTRA